MSQPYQKTRSKFSGIPLEPSKGDSIGISLRLGLSNSNFIGIPLRLRQWDSSRVPLLQDCRPSIRSSARHGLVTHDVASSKRTLSEKKTNTPRVSTKNAKATQRKLWNHVWAGTPWQFSKNTFDDKSKPSEPMSPPTSDGCRDGGDHPASAVERIADRKLRTTPFIINFKSRSHEMSPFNVDERSWVPRAEKQISSTLKGAV